VTYDGIVSRYLNRPLSRPMARALSGTPVTPNAVTIFTLLLAVATGGIIAGGWNIIGGIGIQVVSIIDGVDGELARLKHLTSRFGAVLDAVTDRYADAIIIAGMTVFAFRFEDNPRPEVIGMLALTGSLLVSYSRARIEASLLPPPPSEPSVLAEPADSSLLPPPSSLDPDPSPLSPLASRPDAPDSSLLPPPSSLDSLLGLASRDVRSLIAAIGVIAGQAYWALVILAAASLLTVAWRLLYLRLTNTGTAPHPL
jgi:phosphatidylglycerophosphate synthase